MKKFQKNLKSKQRKPGTTIQISILVLQRVIHTLSKTIFKAGGFFGFLKQNLAKVNEHLNGKNSDFKDLSLMVTGLMSNCISLNTKVVMRTKRMNKVMSMVRILLVGFGCVVLVAMWCIIQTQQKVKIIRVPDPNYIPSAREIQQRLKDLDDPRYDPNGVDGKIGPKTIKAWDNLICDRYAKRAIEGEIK